MMRRKILAVDDEPGVLRAVRRILETRYEVGCAASVEEALSSVQALEPDLAILDIRMPGADGFELMSRLQQIRPDLDVILMTGSVADADQKLIRAIRQKAFYFIQKPFDREVLLTLVERCLELRRLAEDNRRHVARLEAELAQARLFQQNLLPPGEARLPGVTLHARNVPCEELCGDLYDYAASGERSVAFLVADVSGHGASAAMLTGVVKSAFQSANRQAYEPLSVVHSVAAGLRGFMDNHFVTLFCGRLDPAEGVLEYVNAGHPPALLWSGDGPCRLLHSNGPLISPVLEGLVWLQARERLGPRDRLLLYTDGVIEAEGETGQLGLEGLQQVVAATPAGGAVLIETILDHLAGFTRGRRLRDDLTLLTLALERA